MREMKGNYVGYEYTEIITTQEKSSIYLDGYMNFGWELDENVAPSRGFGKVSIKLKRDRKIMHKVELTRLQRYFDACLNEIDVAEQSKTQSATIWALLIGLIGTAFMAGSVFAITAAPPRVVLCIVLAIPAFIGWLLPYFVYNKVVQRRTKIIKELIEQKYDEIYEICEKANKLI